MGRIEAAICNAPASVAALSILGGTLAGIAAIGSVWYVVLSALLEVVR